MTSMRLCRSGRFRLIELIVLTAIAGFALALIPVLVGPAREPVTRLQCQNNMRNIAQAMGAYELNHRHYPGYSNVLRLNNGKVYSDPSTGKPRGVSYVIPLFPYLDQPLLERLWREPAAAQNQQPSKGAAKPHTVDARVQVKILFCPADPPIDERCPLSYVVNCGMPDVAGAAATPTEPGMPRDWAANGVFFDLFTGNPELTGGKAPQREEKPSDDFGVYGAAQSGIPLVATSNDYVQRFDGVGYTCLLSENVDASQYTDDAEAAVGIVWDGSGSVDLSKNPPRMAPPVATMAINVGIGEADSRPRTAYARPSSFHYGGVNTAFCDGRVRFVSDRMDYYVYCLLMSSNGAKVKLPGSNKVLPNFDRPLVGSWYLQ